MSVPAGFVTASQNYSANLTLANCLLMTTAGWQTIFPVVPGWPPPPGYTRTATSTEAQEKAFIEGATNFDHAAYAATVAAWVEDNT